MTVTEPGDSMATSFNLIDEPWIPVLDLDGLEREVSLREAILGSHRYRDLAGELPTMRFALLRVILSVAYRVLDRKRVEEPTEAWGELWKQPELPVEGFGRYFDDWWHRFDLFHESEPFLQAPGLRTAKDEWKPVSLIVADADPEGALFTMRSELGSLSPAEAARWLVHAHAYDYSGIKSGAVGDDRVKGGKGYPMGLGWAGWLGGTALNGRDLRETILLNLIIGRTARNPHDVPIWERTVLTAAKRSSEEIGEIGPLALMTWPQRRIRLRVEEQRVVEVLVANGDELDYTVRNENEPMSGWRFSEPQSAKAKSLRYMPKKLDAGQSLWRGLSTLIPTAASARPSAAAAKKWNVLRVAEPAEVLTWLGRLVREKELPPDRVVEVSVVSMQYGTQNASFEEVVSDRLAFAAALSELEMGAGLLELAQEASSRAEKAVRALVHLAQDIDRAAGGNGEDASGSVGADAFAALDMGFRRWLLGVVPACNGGELLVDWTEQVRDSVSERARVFVARAPDSAWVGRCVREKGKDKRQVLSVGTAMQRFEWNLFDALGAAPGQAERNGDQWNER